MNENKSNNIVIVGNGFDLNLGIKSSYNNFIDSLKDTEKLIDDEEIYNFNKLFIRNFDGNRLNWNDLETIFENQIYEVNSIKYEKDDEIRSRFEIKEINRNLKSLENQFMDYLEDEYEEWKRYNLFKKKDINPLYKAIFKDSEIISFNYTDTLNDLDFIGYSDKDNFFQIHGSLKYKNIIFGGGFSGSNKFEQIVVPGSTDNDKLIRIKKDNDLFNLRYELLNRIYKKNDGSFDTFIIGHSVYGSDINFLMEIFKKSRRIYLFYYGDDYLLKLQMISKVLEKEIIERIVLVPFLNIITSGKDYIHYSSDTSQNDEFFTFEDLEMLKRIFNVTFPTDSKYFNEFILQTNSFIFRDIEMIKLTNTAECRTFFRLIKKFKTAINELSLENVSIIIENIRKEKTSDKEDNSIEMFILEELFETEEFKILLKKCKRLEISNSSFELDVLYNILKEENNLKKLKITDSEINIIEDIDKLEINLDIFTNLSFLWIMDNELYSDKSIHLMSTNFESYNHLKRIVLKKNQNFHIENSAWYAFSDAIFLDCEYSYENDKLSEINLKNIETLILSCEEEKVITLPKLIIADSIRKLELINFQLKDEECSIFKLSSLFFSPTLSQLASIDITTSTDLDSIYFDVYLNMNGKDKNIIFNGTNYSIYELLINKSSKNDTIDEENSNNSNKSITMENTGGSIVSYNSSAKNSEDIILDYLEETQLIHSSNIDDILKEKSVNIFDEIKLFAESWAVSADDLVFYILNYNKDSEKQLGETPLLHSANYSEYAEKDKKNPLRYRNELLNEIKKFARTLREKYNF